MPYIISTQTCEEKITFIRRQIIIKRDVRTYIHLILFQCNKRFIAICNDVCRRERMWHESRSFRGNRKPRMCADCTKECFGFASSIDSGCIELLDVVTLNTIQIFLDLDWGRETRRSACNRGAHHPHNNFNHLSRFGGNREMRIQ